MAVRQDYTNDENEQIKPQQQLSWILRHKLPNNSAAAAAAIAATTVTRCQVLDPVYTLPRLPRWHVYTYRFGTAIYWVEPLCFSKEQAISQPRIGFPYQQHTDRHDTRTPPASAPRWHPRPAGIRIPKDIFSGSSIGPTVCSHSYYSKLRTMYNIGCSWS